MFYFFDEDLFAVCEPSGEPILFLPDDMTVEWGYALAESVNSIADKLGDPEPAKVSRWELRFPETEISEN